MKKQRIRTADVGEPPEGTWSNCLVIDKYVYIAGMTSRSDEFDTIVGKDRLRAVQDHFRQDQGPDTGRRRNDGGYREGECVPDRRE